MVDERAGQSPLRWGFPRVEVPETPRLRTVEVGGYPVVVPLWVYDLLEKEGGHGSSS
jgi:hypothetical protein